MDAAPNKMRRESHRNQPRRNNRDGEDGEKTGVGGSPSAGGTGFGTRNAYNSFLGKTSLRSSGPHRNGEVVGNFLATNRPSNGIPRGLSFRPSETDALLTDQCVTGDDDVYF